MKNYRVIKVDRRYNGYGYFKWIVEPVAPDNSFTSTFLITRDVFHYWRVWCAATWGAGMERSWCMPLAHANRIPMPIWAWDTEHGNKRLYLQGDAELTVFELKF
jgi:hypothetical protein